MAERTREARLLALRSKLEKALRVDPPPSPRDLAGLSREYRAVLTELDEIRAAAEQADDTDEIDAIALEV